MQNISVSIVLLFQMMIGSLTKMEIYMECNIRDRLILFFVKIWSLGVYMNIYMEFIVLL